LAATLVGWIGGDSVYRKVQCVTSNRQPRNAAPGIAGAADGPRAQNGKGLKGGQSDANYVSILLDGELVFQKSSPLPTYFTVRSECCRGHKNYSYATGGKVAANNIFSVVTEVPNVLTINK